MRRTKGKISVSLCCVDGINRVNTYHQYACQWVITFKKISFIDVIKSRVVKKITEKHYPSENSVPN